MGAIFIEKGRMQMAHMIPQAVIDDVREKTNIVDIVGQYVQLKKSGKNYFGLCPFHEERTSSFSVAEDKQIFHCFGCGKGGNVFTFIQEIEGVSFPEAVEKVAQLESIPLSVEFTVNQPKQNPKQQKLIVLHEKARDLFHHVLLNTKVGAPALAYLEKRGIPLELIKEFKIGFAPSQRDFLVEVFNQENVSAELLEMSGLFVKRDSGEFSDRFYQRIMFPINDFNGKTIGFSGRWLETPDYSSKDQPKYLNSPETELFNKRQVLFNYDRARKEVRHTSEIFLFEGFMDVIAAWQAGIKNGVASMGTSLTENQITAIQRLTDSMVVVFDGDKAGIEATNRALELLSSQSSLNLSVVQVPEKLDPDEYLRKYGEEDMRNLLIHGRKKPFQFKMFYYRQDRNLANETERLSYIDILLQDLTKVDSMIERDMYLSQISEEFQVSRDSLQQRLQQLTSEHRQQNRQQRRAQKAQIKPETQSRKTFSLAEKAERMLIYRSMNESRVRNLLIQQNVQFLHDKYQEIFLLLDSFMATHEEFVLADFIDFIKENHLKEEVVDIAVMPMTEGSSEREITDLLQVIRHQGLADEINVKKQEQLEAKKNGNQQREFELTVQIIELTKKLKNA